MLEPALSDYISVAGGHPAVQHLIPSAGGDRQGSSPGKKSSIRQIDVV